MDVPLDKYFDPILQRRTMSRKNEKFTMVKEIFMTSRQRVLHYLLI